MLQQTQFWGTTNVNRTGTSATSIGNTTGNISLTGATNTILGTKNVNTAGTATTSIGNTTGAFALTGSVNTFTSTGRTQINSGILDINAAGITALDFRRKLTVSYPFR